MSKTVPNLPQHNLPEPFAALQTIGDDVLIDLYIDLEENTAEEDVPEVVSRLADMALDVTYYSYGNPAETGSDSRCYTPLHAVRTLCYFCEEALAVVPRLIPLFASEDDNLREELPLLYASIGPDVTETLSILTLDKLEEIYIREGAGSSLVELAELCPEVKEHTVNIIEEALGACGDNELCGYFILNLLDLGSVRSRSLIEKAFEEERVDLEVVSFEDVLEHFATISLETYSEPKQLMPVYLIDDDAEEEYREPYVAPAKIGRNDPCPCGSGKKYKKCCGISKS